MISCRFFMHLCVEGSCGKTYHFSHCIINETSLRFYNWNLRLVVLSSS